MKIVTAKDLAMIRKQVARHIKGMDSPYYERAPGIHVRALLQTLHAAKEDLVALSLILVLSLAGQRREEEVAFVLVALDCPDEEMPFFSEN
jgi:hypothetical protein